MKRKLINHLQKLTPHHINNIKSILKLTDDASLNTISSFMSSYIGLNLLFESLSQNDIKVIKLLLENDLEYRQIQKTLKIDIEEIEHICNELSNKGIIYIQKNRKLLNNLLDKAILFEEIKQKINPFNINDFNNNIEKINTNIINKNNQYNDTSLTKNELEFLKQLYEKGVMASLSYIIRNSPYNKNELEITINNLYLNHYIKVFHYFENKFTTLIILTEKAFNLFYKDNTTNEININNHYQFVNAMLHLHKLIYLNRIYLNNDGTINKNDINKYSKHLTEYKLKITDNTDKTLGEAQKIEFLLNISNCSGLLNYNKNFISTNIEILKNIIEQPEKINNLITNNLDNEKILFNDNPIKIYNKDIYKNLLMIISKHKKLNYLGYKYLFIFKIVLENTNSLYNIDNIVEEAKETFINSINFFVLIGKIKIIKNNIYINQSKQKIAKPIIYVNPDFSILIPYNDIDSSDLYIISVFTKIKKNDVLIQTSIEKKSFIEAIQFGFNPDNFVNLLTKLTINEIPQNILFLLNQWKNDYTFLDIKDVTIIESNNKNIIDELMHLQTTKDIGIVKRLNDNCLIIKKEKLKSLIQILNKKDLAINIYTEDY